MLFSTPEKLQFYHLSIALAIGLLIGLERGWRGRDGGSTEPAAGIRTYGLTGLLGGCSVMLAQDHTIVLLGLFFVGLCLLLGSVYILNNYTHKKDIGITSLIAALLAFVLGALASIGQETIATSAAVITTLLLSYKSSIHRWMSKLNAQELHAILQLLLISVLILPLLPNQTYDPWHALNPYEIWLMVVLIATVSFMGYFALKIGGSRRGAVFTGLFSGLVSSTALTLSFSRLARQHVAIQHELAAGILIACAAMFPRMLLLASIINHHLLNYLWLPTLGMSAMLILPAIFYLQNPGKSANTTHSPISNPLELEPAIIFGLFLAGIMLLSKILKNTLGDAGIFMLSALSGIMDVDAINLSLSRMSLEDLDITVAVTGIVIAAISNTCIKGIMAGVIGGKKMGLYVSLPLILSSVLGILLIER